MKYVGQKRNRWGVRSLPMLAVALAPIFAWGADSVGGGYRVRSEVNSGGEFFQKVDGVGYRLHGSVGGIGSTIAFSPNNKIQAGGQASFYFPKPIMDLKIDEQPTNFSVKLRWHSIGGGTQYKQTVGSYDIRYKEDGGLTPENFHLANKMAGVPPIPTGIDLSEATTLGDLNYDTLYDFGVVSLDGDSLNNEAFLGNVASTRTLALTPDIKKVTSSTKGRSVSVQYEVTGFRGDHPITYEIEISTKVDFKPLYGGAIPSSHYSTGPLSGANHVFKFESLAPNTYYVQVRSLNQANATSGWVSSRPILLGSGSPILNDPSAVTATSAHISWERDSEFLDSLYKVEYSLDKDFAGATNSFPLSPLAIGNVTVPGLTPNATWYFRVLSSDTPPSASVSVVTNVHKAQSVSATDIYQTSATVTWADHPSNGADSHSFRLLVSSDSDFLSGNKEFPSFPYTGLSYSQKVDDLIPNTTYYVRVLAFNRGGVESIEGATSSTFVTAPVPLPVGSVSTVDSGVDKTRQVKVSWVDPHNSTETRYRVELSSTNFASVSSFSVVGPGVHEHLFESNDMDNPGFPVLANTQYHVRVRPIITATREPMPPQDSVEVWTRPIPPQNLTPLPFNNSISVTWIATKEAAMNNPSTRYGLEWKDPKEEGGKLLTEGTGLNATATPLDRNTKYILKVTARAKEGIAYDVFASTDDYTLSDPTEKPTATATPTTLTVRWGVGLNPEGTEYRVVLSTDTNYLDDPSFTVTVPSKTFPDLDSNRIYHFQVNTINSEGKESSPQSNFAFTKPMAPIISTVTRSSSQLTFEWLTLHNILGTKYLPVLDGASRDDRITEASMSLFSGFTPNSRHDFRVGAKSDGGSATDTAFSISTTVWTNAEVPLEPILERMVNLTTFYIKFFRGANPPETEYAVQVIQDPYLEDPLSGQYLDLKTDAISPTGERTPVWKTLSGWGTLQGTGYRLQLTGIPTRGGFFLQLKARNKEGFETDFGGRMEVLSISGVPSVKLLEESGSKVIAVATDTDKVPFFINWKFLRFTAEGAGHFNFLLNQESNGLESLLSKPENYPGWNGELENGTDCKTPGPMFAEKLPGFCAEGEGIYYFHIIGNRVVGSSLSDSYESTPSFRMFIDLTPPLAGRVEASSNDYPIDSDGPTLGLTTLNFTWPVTDGGEATSRSPIVGWSYSFSLNDADRVPTFDKSGGFVVGSSVTLRLGEAIGHGDSLPSTGTYTFKVRGVDKAGNWQSEPSVFTYNFKEDSNPPSFKGVTIGGAKMPKAGFRYAAVPVDVPIQLNFSEPMNFSAGLGGIQFIQTHNASGRLRDPLVLIFVSSAVDRGGTTAMMVERVEREERVKLEPGSRYEIHSSTSNLFDLGGNRLPPDQKFDIVFFTQMDPSAPSVFETEDGHAKVTVAAGALGSKPSGVAFDGKIKDDPMKVGEMVRRASGLVSHRTGGAFNQVLDTVEYNQFGADGTLFHSPFLGPVTLRFKYQDNNRDGIEDRSEPGHPIKIDKLAIYGLDEETGVWLRLPGSRVEAGTEEVSVDLRHFSAYALMGSGDFDLTDAHVYPVPFRAKKDNSITFVFPHAQMATVKIYTLDGKLVKTLSDDKGTGFVRWDPVVNEDGDPVGSDVYLYVIENDQQRKVGKLMVIR